MNSSLLRSYGAFALSLACAATACAPSDTDAEAAGEALSAASTRDWLRANVDAITTVDPIADDGDMGAFGELVGDAPAVGLGEVAHGAHEPMQLKVRLFKYLAEHKGFRAMTMESGLPESRLADRYVLGLPDDREGHVGQPIELKEALLRGITHEMGLFEEMKTLLEWLREYNETQPEAQKVHYVGVDVSAKGSAFAVPLRELARYLGRVDPSFVASAELAKTLALAEKATEILSQVEAGYQAAGATEIDGDFVEAYGKISFDRLSPNEQDDLERGIEALAARFAANAAAYTAASSEPDFAWQSRLVVAAQHYMRDMRTRQRILPIVNYCEAVKAVATAMGVPGAATTACSDGGALTALGAAAGLRVDPRHVFDLSDGAALHQYQVARESRELAIFENFVWAQERYGKAMIYAHNGHLAKAKLPDDPTAARAGGNFIAEHYGKGFVMIATTTDHAVDAAGNPTPKLASVPVAPMSGCGGCVEGDFALLEGTPAMFLVDLRNAPAAMKGNRGVRFIGSGQGFVTFDVGASFDAFVYSTTMKTGIRLPR